MFEKNIPSPLFRRDGDPKGTLGFELPPTSTTNFVVDEKIGFHSKPLKHTT
jgi:hypothetical protein